jgi:hypothetical protein
VQALSTVFRGKFIAALAAAHHSGSFERDPQGRQAAWRERQSQLYKHDWVVYAKAPLAGPAQVLAYPSRYTHRTAISNERLRSVTAQAVTFRVRADEHGAKRLVRLARLDGVEFVRRFLLHVRPKGLKRIRHCGVLASSYKAAKLAQARAALTMPTGNLMALESAAAFAKRTAGIDAQQCPCCSAGRLCVVQTLAGPRQLPTASSTVLPQGRAPP